MSNQEAPDDGSGPKRFECYWIPLARLHYRSTPSWDAGLIRLHETCELSSEAGTESTQYDFTMRPWCIDEATERLTAAGFVAVDIRKGVGRKTDDRFIAVAHTALPVSAPA